MKPRQPGERDCAACGAKSGRRDGRLKDEGRGRRLPSGRRFFFEFSLVPVAVAMPSVSW